MERRAQTNIQLFNQLIALGFDSADLMIVRRSYSVAARIFAGQIRPEGRPFICHLIGVASILADLGQPVVVICAGLLHSAYTQGDFGAGRGIVSERSRLAFCQSLDPKVLEIIDAYAHQAWNAATIQSWITKANPIDDPLKTVITVRLADALEDTLDFGLRYSGKGKKHSINIPPNDIVSLAETMEIQCLATALRHSYEDKGNREYFRILRENTEGSSMLAPMSYRRKIIAPALSRLYKSYLKLRKGSR